MSGFYTDPTVIDAYAEEILKESEKKPIVESASTFNEIKTRRGGGYVGVDVLLVETTISLLWSDVAKIKRVNKLFMTVYNMLGSSFPGKYKAHLSFSFCLIREHQDRPPTYSLFVGHNNHNNVHSPTYQINTFLADPKDIRTFSRKLIYETDFEDIALKLYRQSVSPDSKTRIHKIYTMILSILL